tara:strand:- start:122 stop:727 length:606 start_codon:yes stop_codon:yes gene_type:complete
MKYFLTEIAKERGITMQEWSEGVGVCESTARWHLKAKRIPEQKCWKRIARFLKLPLLDIESLFREELKIQGRIGHCKVCDVEFYRFSRKQLCGDIECSRAFDRERKAEIRRKYPSTFVPLKRLSEKDFLDTVVRKRPQISREELSVKVNEFLSSGGRIKVLKPAMADGLLDDHWEERHSAKQRFPMNLNNAGSFLSVYNDF